MHGSSAARRSLLAVGLSAACPAAEDPPEDRVTVARLGKPPPAQAEAGPPPDAGRLLARARRDFAPLPEAALDPENPLTEQKISLGRMLYYDPRLSKNHDVPCESCHPLADYGADGEKTSVGHRGQRGERNAPTVYNAGFHLAQFWDGRAADLEEQAQGPILNPIEMALPDEATAVAVLASIPAYAEAFAAAFPGEGLTYKNIARAIASFERKLVTPAPFDRFLAGDTSALPGEALQGLSVFYEAGCITCHTGVAVGGTMFQKLGSVKPYPTADLGRFAVTELEPDRHVFKVPSLRNVARTAPYLHDGSVATLEQMVQIMVEHQTSKGTLSAAEMRALLAFLDALTGEIPGEYVARPELPPSGPTTPGPDPT